MDKVVPLLFFFYKDGFGIELPTKIHIQLNKKQNLKIYDKNTGSKIKRKLLIHIIYMCINNFLLIFNPVF